MAPIYNHSRESDGANRDTPKPQKLTLGSLFDGSGGFPLGGLLSGITPVWASEIEPFPIRVTTKRLPFMKHYGDVAKMDGGKIEPVDIITFGSPCQDMSIAGRREGLDGSRSSLFYEKETSPTLRAGTVPAAVYENHSQDTRYTGPLETAPTVNATYGMGGNNQPFVVETPKTLKIRSGCEGGGKGALIQDNKSATLGCNNDQALFVPKVYGICSKDSNAMKSDNPKSGFYEAETSRCLDANGGNPTCNQGGMAVVALQGSMIGRADKNGPQGSGVNEGVSFTLDAADRHAVAYCMTTGTYTQALEEQSPTLMARDYKDPPVVNETEPEYIVRRLTPTECARLQGFPDWWCARLETDEPTEEEIEFWTEVFEIHRSLMGTSSKPKSRNQIVKWLKNPHSDSAEYKMWGNGVALPNVYFVLSGIVYYAQFSEE